MSAIDTKHASLAGASGLLGSPVETEKICPDKIGHYRHYQNGSIYWKPSIGAHEVHGLIRGYWSAHGWETNPSLGYPISDELPTKKNSANRYSDFENGVLFWKSGSDHAVELAKLTINNASRPVANVLEEISKILLPKLTSDKRVRISKGPYLAEVTDYSFDGTVHNRRHKVHVDLHIDVSGMPDPTVNLDIWLEISLDRASNSVNAYLVDYHLHAHVPFPTSAGVSASTINAQFKAALDPVLWKPNVVGIIPAGINLLSVKVLPNGDVNSYMEPGCFLTTACAVAQQLPDDCYLLERLRRFRADYLQPLPQGPQLLEEYAWVAPQLVAAIEATPEKQATYEQLLAVMQQAVALIEQGENEAALALYQQTMRQLSARFLALAACQPASR